ncbi:MAG: hypothetical protein EPO40_20915 [Myxococcaceae bacterium]|nr:MAG: hypothetical protein EPO40_20915 [Myxococcaceae bacterium]
MRKPTFAIGSLVLVLGALASVVVAQPRPRPVVRPVRADASVATDAAAASDAATPSPDATVADAAGPAAVVVEDGGVRVGDASIPMRQLGTGTVIHFPVPEQLARTAVPVFAQIRSTAPIDHVSLFYRSVGARSYTEVRMPALGQQFRLPSGYGAMIPCDDIFPPRVEYYVAAIDSSGAPNGGAGTAEAPVQINIVERRSFAAPTLPGQPAPRTCGSLSVTATVRDAGSGPAAVERGTADLGEPCRTNNECRRGLRCGLNHQCVFDR